MSKKNIVKINDKYFMIISSMKLKSGYNLLGFFSHDSKTWEKHVKTVNLTEEEFNQLQPIN